MSFIKVPLVFAVTVITLGLVVGNHEQEHELFIAMPDVSPQEQMHLQHAMKLSSDHPYYITGISPAFQYSHHVLLQACREPFSSESVWSGDFACKVQIQSDVLDVYAISEENTYLDFPEGVGMKVGGDSEYLYLVLRVHYFDLEPFLSGAVDSTGLKVFYTTIPPRRLAGQLFVLSEGFIHPGERKNIDAAVVIDEDVVLHPFAYMVHTHSLGLVVSAYRVRDDQWTEIGRRSPQVPNIYVPAKPVTLRKGDVVATRCVMFNNLDHVVHTGQTMEREMCAFRLLYYVSGEKLFSTSVVVSNGPHTYSWDTDERLNTSNVPVEASEIPLPPDGPDPDNTKQEAHEHGMRAMDII